MAALMTPRGRGALRHSSPPAQRSSQGATAAAGTAATHAGLDRDRPGRRLAGCTRLDAHRRHGGADRSVGKQPVRVRAVPDLPVRRARRRRRRQRRRQARDRHRASQGRLDGDPRLRRHPARPDRRVRAVQRRRVVERRLRRRRATRPATARPRSSTASTPASRRQFTFSTRPAAQRQPAFGPTARAPRPAFASQPPTSTATARPRSSRCRSTAPASAASARAAATPSASTTPSPAAPSVARRSAAGDVVGDRAPELVAAARTATGMQVNVIDTHTGAVVASLHPYVESPTTTPQIAVGDVNGDGHGDIVLLAQFVDGARLEGLIRRRDEARPRSTCSSRGSCPEHPLPRAISTATARRRS